MLLIIGLWECMVYLVGEVGGHGLRRRDGLTGKMFQCMLILELWLLDLFEGLCQLTWARQIQIFRGSSAPRSRFEGGRVGVVCVYAERGRAG